MFLFVKTGYFLNKEKKICDKCSNKFNEGCSFCDNTDCFICENSYLDPISKSCLNTCTLNYFSNNETHKC